MITGLPSDESAAFVTRLTPDIIDLTLDRLTRAIRGTEPEVGAAAVRRLRAIIDRAVPDHSMARRPPGTLSPLVGSAVTLQYPLMELERFLNGERCDIDTPRQAQLYLSFVRHHLWKLEHLLRDSARA